MVTMYEERQEQVLVSHRNFAEMMAQFMRFSNVLAPSDVKKIDDIAAQAEKIKNDIFILMVAGESNSGKSTFINAYLGGEILPMDVKQCTSSIIEIFYNEEYELTAEYVDKRYIKITSIEEVVSFLKNHAALSDSFRDIPASTINQELLIKYQGKPRESDIRHLIEGVKEDNINNLPEDIYAGKIRDYIKQNADRWNDIVTKIRIGWPLGEALRNITIVDSPGVNAKGLVGEITQKYIEKANAVMFTKSLSGQVLESKSFMEFMKNSSMDRHKETLFLILTRAADFSTNELNSSYSHAVELYPQLGKDRILMVDSKIQLILNKCLQMDTDDEISDYLKSMADSADESDNLSRSIAYTWFVTDRMNRIRFEESMYSMSRFRQIQSALERFARSAQDLALLILLDDIEKIYTLLSARLVEQISLLEIGLDDIDELRRQIEIKKKEIAEIQDKLNVTIEQIKTEYIATTYLGPNNAPTTGLIWKTKDERLENFRIRLDECNSLEGLRNEMSREINNTGQYLQEVSDSIIRKCNDSLIALTSESAMIDFTFLVPSFTEQDFKAISASTKTKSFRDESHIETRGWICPKYVVVTKSVYSPDKHKQQIRKILTDNMDQIGSLLADNICDYVLELTAVYKKKLREKSEEKKDEYSRLITQLENLESTLALISQYEQYIACLNKLKSVVSGIKGGIAIHG